MKRWIISGGRHFCDGALFYKVVAKMMENLLEEGETIEIYQGGATGADLMARNFAASHRIKCTSFPALWDVYGKNALEKRDTKMMKNADFMLVFWNGNSKGTKHMIKEMNKLGKPYVICYYNKGYTPSEILEYFNFK